MISSPGPLLALSLIAAVPFQAPDRSDHPLLTRYTGSTVSSKQFEEYGSYRLATRLNDRGELEGATLEGRVTRFIYTNPTGRSTLEIYRNYEQALRAAGLQVTWSCALTECGPGYAMSMWGRFNGLAQAATSGDPRYLAGTVRTRTGTAHVAVMVGRSRTQVDIVEMRAMEAGMVVSDASALAEGLDKDGRVTVGGIYFDTDKAVVKPESKAALDQVAELLRMRPNLRVFVVGHTDITGELAHNRQLSEARARAVVAKLVQEYGIAASRLDGYGVGPLAPAGSNATESGRRLNRRVDLVGR